MEDSEDYYNNSGSEDMEDVAGDSGGSGDEYMDDSDDDSIYAMDVPEPTAKKAPFKVMNREQLQQARTKSIQEVTVVTGISEEEAARVLRKYKWNYKQCIEDWYDHEENIRQSVGLLDEKPQPSGAEGRCNICFETYPYSAMLSASCKHFFCKNCWKGYVQEAVSNGPTCLDLRCPAPDCKPKACVPSKLALDVIGEKEREQYRYYLLRSFVEDNPHMSWCTGQNCENAVECNDHEPGVAVDVSCNCGTIFCFNCKEEAHRPVACDTVKKWITKNSAESENLNWILANTKPCPKCKRPIEKNQGCMHMTCSQCRHEFCWLCSGDWKEHGERTGGFYACNRFETAKRKGELDDDQRRRETAKASLERYMHYFERFDAHSKAREKAKQEAAKVSSDWLEHLADTTKTPTSQLKFINEAWSQIIECRRMLKWTYAYGYYSFEDYENKTIEQQRTFFEFLQGDAERSLERLHEAAETELRRQVEAARSNPAGFDAARFQEFRKNLIGLTDVTRGFFEKLVKQLVKGFTDLEADYAGQVEEPEPVVATEGGAGPSSAAGGGSGSGQALARGGSSGAGRGGAAAAGGAAGRGRRAKKPRGGIDSEASGELAPWACPHCTFTNTDPESTECEMCKLPRDGN